jgi:hypothetical protein
MPKGERIIDPVSQSAGYCKCGYVLPPGRARPTDLWVAAHRAHHLNWLGPRSLAEWRDLAEAQRLAITVLETDRRDLYADLGDAQDRIEQLEAELDAINRFGIGS